MSLLAVKMESWQADSLPHKITISGDRNAADPTIAAPVSIDFSSIGGSSLDFFGMPDGYGGKLVYENSEWSLKPGERGLFAHELDPNGDPAVFFHPASGDGEIAGLIKPYRLDPPNGPFVTYDVKSR